MVGHRPNISEADLLAVVQRVEEMEASVRVPFLSDYCMRFIVEQMPCGATSKRDGGVGAFLFCPIIE